MAKIRPSGGYRELRSFQIATIIYDATYWFCERFLEPRTRMSDQMVQAARSGRQKIAEGSRACATSSQTELRLVNVARSSLEALLLDYEDYLRHRRLPQWVPESAQARAVRARLASDRSDSSDLPDAMKTASAEAAANTLLCLINQVNTLLDRQIEALEKAVIAEGGYSEQPHAVQGQKRASDQSDGADTSDKTKAPACPKCGKPMALRTAQKGKNAGKQFWGCTGYPECKKIAEI